MFLQHNLEIDCIGQIYYDEPTQNRNILLEDILETDIDYTTKCRNIQLQKSLNGIEILKAHLGLVGSMSNKHTQKSLTRTLKAGGKWEIKVLEMIDLTMFRKLTPIECERLQSVPLNYTDCVSNNQRYRMLGNGWTVDVIAHIFLFKGREILIIF